MSALIISPQKIVPVFESKINTFKANKCNRHITLVFVPLSGFEGQIVPKYFFFFNLGCSGLNRAQFKSQSQMYIFNIFYACLQL